MKKLFLAILLLPCFSVFAQIKFEPGYFINNDGTKTECLIKNIGWKNNPVSFDYKANENTEAITKSINDAAGLEVSGYKFLRFTTGIERSATSVGQIDENIKPDFKTETLFLKVLAEGKINLYSYEDGNVIKYFTSTAPHLQAVQLVYIKYIRNSKVWEYSQFRQQLYELMTDRNVSLADLENVMYNRNSLVKVITKYNAENGTNRDLSSAGNKGSFNFKITAGISVAKVKMVNNSYVATTPEASVYIQDNFSFSTAVVPSLGIEAEFILPFNNNKWSVFTNPNLQMYKSNGKIDATGWNGTHKYDIELKYNFLEIPLGGRYYMFLNPDTRLYLEANYTYALLMDKSEVKFNKQKIFDVASTSGFSAGTGLCYKPFTIGLRYNFNRELVQNVNTSVKYSSIMLNINYKLF